MCETTSEYKHGDIAWVKLGNCWWPGEVIEFDQLIDSVKEEFQTSSKNKFPLAFVKFFQEDSYEYVKKSDKIFPYNCPKKDEFIKKGMDMHRAKKSNMEKFPEDVGIAEKRTGGNENILEDPKYGPQKKPERYSDFFGTPKTKNSPKLGRGGRASLKAGSPLKRTPPQYVTHPRFIGQNSDHKRTVLMQTKKEETKENTFKCPTCGFASSRIDAIILHNKTHIKSDPLFNDKRKKGKKSQSKRSPRKTINIPTSKTNSIDEDLALLERGLSLTDGEMMPGDGETEKKRKKKRKRAPAQENQPSSKKPAPDIKNDLLAEWDDMDDEDDEDKSIDSESMNNTLDSSIEGSPKIKESEKVEKANSPKPQTVAADNAKANKSTNEVSPGNSENSATLVDASKEEFDFNKLLETTKVPEMPTLPKSKDDVKEVATKLTNPKKRFVKSFEDFELSMKEKEQEKEKEVLKIENKPESEKVPEKIEEHNLEKEKELVVDDKVESKPEEKEEEKKPQSSDVDEETDEPKKIEEEVIDKKAVEIIVEERKTRRSSARMEKDKVEEKPIEQLRKSTRRSEIKPVVKAVEVVEEKEKKDEKSKGKKEDIKKPEVVEPELEKVEKEAKSIKKIKEETKVTKETKKEVDKSKKEEADKSKKEEIVDKPVTVEEEPKTLKTDTKPALEEESKATKKDPKLVVEVVEKDKPEKPEKKVSEHRIREKPKEKILTEIDVFGSLRAQENEKYNKKSEDSPRRETRSSRSKSRSESASTQERKVSIPESSRVSSRRSKKEEPTVEPQETQVNNGKNDDSSPLISKMKNKLMNMLNTEQEEIPKSPKSRKPRVSARSSVHNDEIMCFGAEVDEPSEKNDTTKADIAAKGKSLASKAEKEAKEKEDKKGAKDKEDKKEVVKDKEEQKETLKSAESTRRHSLRSTPMSEKASEKDEKVETVEKIEKVEKKKVVSTKAEVKSPVLTRFESRTGPKTYLRASRAHDRVEAEIKLPIASKSSLGSPKKAEIKGKASKATNVQQLSNEQIIEDNDDIKMETDDKPIEKVNDKIESKDLSPTKSSSKPEEVKRTKSSDTLILSPQLDLSDESEKETEPIVKSADVEKDKKSSTTSESNAMDWIRTLSPIKKKIFPVEESPTREEEDKAKDTLIECKPSTATVSPVKTPLSPFNVSTSPIKAPDLPTKSASPVKSPAPNSPGKTTAPGSPVKSFALGSPVKSLAPGSPVKSPAPASPVKSPAPASPVKSPAPGSPVKSSALGSPVKSSAPGSPVKSSAPGSPVRGSAPDSPVRGSAPDSPVKSSAPGSPVKSPAPGSPVKSPAPGSPVKSPAPGSPVKSTAPNSPIKTSESGSPVKIVVSSPTTTASPIKSPDSPIKAPASPAKSPGSPTKVPAAPVSPIMLPSLPMKTPSSPVTTKPPSPITSSPLPMMKSTLSPIRSPPSPMKSAPSPIKSPPPAMKSPPIILNKDAPKFEPAKKLQKKEEEAPVKVAVVNKSPRRISLTSQELSIEKITDKFEITVNNNESNDGATEEIKPIEHSLDILASASVSTQNKDVVEKSVTVVPQGIFDAGQVEIAKIIEGGTEKVASIPNVIVQEKESKIEIQIPKVEEAPAVVAPPVVIPVSERKTVFAEVTLQKPAEREVTITAVPVSKPEPIILNSRYSADQESTSKLLDILTDNKRTVRPTVSSKLHQQQQVPLPKVANPKFEIDAKKPSILAMAPKQSRILATGGTPGPSRSKPTILSDTLIKPASSATEAVVSVQKLKRQSNDIEDIDTFIITKHPKKDEVSELKKVMAAAIPTKSKLKILDHTIVTAAGQVKKQPIVHHQTVKVPSGTGKTVEEKVYELLNSPQSSREDDTFDIDNMPIVLSDQLFTTDSIESMSVVTQEQPKKIQTQAVHQVIKKPLPQKVAQKQQIYQTATTARTPTTKTYTKLVKGQRIYQTSTPTLLKHSPTIISQGGKPGKFVIVPSQSSTPTGNKYTVGKRQVLKKPAILATSKASQSISEPTGNKIMILTNNQGQQSRVLLTPEHQKLMGYQTTQVKKSFVKGVSPMQTTERKLLGQTSTASPGSGLMQVKKPKVDATKQKVVGQKFSLQGALPPLKGPPGQTRTVIIKNQQGQIVNRIHGTCDEDIEKQVAEQLEAINRAANAKAQAAQMKGKTMKRVVKKAVPAAMSEVTRTAIQTKALNSTAVSSAPSKTVAATIPPLAPISPAKKLAQEQSQMQKQVIRQQKVAITSTVSTAASSASRVATKVETPPQQAPTKVVEKPEAKEERTPKQLVIQDAMGNETTIMEGQILALPSETVDGQPQSYMLVTLDESGSLTPLNNEALMSLDPNLNLGGDLSNMVLQIEGGGASEATEAVTTQSSAPTTIETTATAPATEVATPAPAPAPEQIELPAPAVTVPPKEEEILQMQVQPATETVHEAEAPAEQMQAIACHINKGDVQQQLIITGDPIATQKFLESLTEGNAEIANLLAQAEGSNILIHTDGQQILINTDADSQMLMSLNTEAEAIAESTGNPIFGTATDSNAKIQDILAAALADTDVIQQEQSISGVKVTQAQVSPGYPMAVNNVLETSTVNSPIMTPLEVPSANSKKIETDVLHQITKNIDLPITITDPNIAHSVSNQQVSLMSSDLTATMELPLTIQDVPTTSNTDMNSPNSFSYSLPSLDDSEKFTSPISMPLLTEDPEEVQTSTASTSQKDTTSSQSETSSQDSDSKSHEGTAEYLLATSDMCTMSSQMGSLSEPPQDMFDFPLDQAYESKQEDVQFCNSNEEIPTESHMDTTGILVSKSPKRGLDDESTDDANKRSKLD